MEEDDEENDEEDDDGGGGSDEGRGGEGGARQQGTPRRTGQRKEKKNREQARRPSPFVFGKRKTIVPFADPGPRPTDGISKITGRPETPQEIKEREGKHRAWREAVQEHTNAMLDSIQLRSGCEARVFNRMGLELCEKLPGFRDQLLSLGFMQRERHAAISELAEQMENTLKLLYDDKDPLKTRQVSSSSCTATLATRRTRPLRWSGHAKPRPSLVRTPRGVFS